MSQREDSSKRDRDGVVRFERPGSGNDPRVLGAAVLVLLVLAGAAAWLLWPQAEPAPRVVAAAAPAPGPKSDPEFPPMPPVEHRAPAAPQVEEVRKEEPVPAQKPPEASGGMALFPPPGTKPIKRGILVPEGFELPPGYMRHFQTTDDGQQLPAILVFHPDFQPKDRNGKPVPMPPDRVVPPELAPPGLPIQMLVPPGEAPPEPGR